MVNGRIDQETEEWSYQLDSRMDIRMDAKLTYQMDSGTDRQIYEGKRIYQIEISGWIEGRLFQS
jgi:hypothetical protein